MVLSHGGPLRKRVEWRFPPLSLFSGHRTVQAIRWPTVHGDDHSSDDSADAGDGRQVFHGGTKMSLIIDPLPFPRHIPAKSGSLLLLAVGGLPIQE